MTGHGISIPPIKMLIKFGGWFIVVLPTTHIISPEYHHLFQTFLSQSPVSQHHSPLARPQGHSRWFEPWNTWGGFHHLFFVGDICIYIYIYIWANYNNSLTWNKAIWGWFPLLTMIPVRSQWGRYNLPRYIYIYNIMTQWYNYIDIHEGFLLSIDFWSSWSWICIPSYRGFNHGLLMSIWFLFPTVSVKRLKPCLAFGHFRQS